MRHGLAAVAIMAFVAVSAATAAESPITITKSEARSLPPQRVKSRVMSQLSDLLTEDRWMRRRALVNALSDMNFTAKPRPGIVPGLCQVDKLTISFRPAKPGKADADTPVAADGFSAGHYFYFKQAPKRHFRSLVSDDYEPDEAACDDVAFAKNDYFKAPSDEVATDAYFLAGKVMSDILEGKAQFTFECDKLPIEKDRPCSDIVRELKGVSIDLIEQCDTGGDGFELCYQLYAGDRYMRIVASPLAYGPNSLPPMTPLRVTVGELIVMSHERID